MAPDASFFVLLSVFRIGIDLYAWTGVRFLTHSWSVSSRRMLRTVYFGWTIFQFLFFLNLQGEFLPVSKPLQQWILVLYYLLMFAKIAWIPFIALDDFRRI